MSPTSKKIVGGMLALLFIVTIVQTQAIMKIANDLSTNKTFAVGSPEDQKAQAAIMANCFQITPGKHLMTSPYVADGISGGGYPVYEIGRYYIFRNFFQIKNKCSYAVGILNSSDLVPYDANNPNYNNPNPNLLLSSSLMLGSSEILLPSESPSLNDIGSSMPVPNPPLVIEEYLNPESSTTVSIPATNVSGVSSFAINAGNDIYAGVLQPGETRSFMYAVTAKVYPATTLAITLNKIKWFRYSDYTGNNILTAAEIKTYNLSQSIQNQLKNNYLNF